MIEADAYFFDIDGTLMVTRDLVHWNGLHQAILEGYGIDTTIEGITYHGKTDVAILRTALNRAGISDSVFYENLPKALAVVCREVSANCAAIVPNVCPGIPEILAEIRESGRFLGVASGNLEEVAWHKIRAAKLRDFFQFGSFGDSRELRSQIFDHAVSQAKQTLGTGASVCFVGDTPDDISAARAVHAKIIAVGTGTFSNSDLAAHAPDLCCASCVDLTGKLRRKVPA